MFTSLLIYSTQSNLSKLNPEKDFVTTSLIIAEKAGIKHRSLKRTLERHEIDIKQFGEVRFKITPRSGEKVYEINEKQAVFLITLLRNSKKVTEFKSLLVQEFFKMREELQKRKEVIEDRSWVQRAFTNEIVNSGEQERMHGKAFSTYTNLVYSACFGLSKKKYLETKEIKEQKNSSLFDYLHREDFLKAKNAMIQVIGLLEQGKQYKEVKEELLGGKNE